MPTNYSNLVNQLQAVGIGYDDRHQRTEATADLDIAIQLFQELLDATPADHPDRAHRLERLGIGYNDQYLRTGATADLNTAIQLYQESLNTTPADHPDRAFRLQNLGTGYEDRHRRIEATADLDKAIQLYQESLNHTLSPIRIRIESGKRLLPLLCTKANNWPQAFQFAHAAISLVPLLTPRSLQNSDKQYLLASIAGLASDAAAVSLNAGHPPFDAIQVLELGRGVITGSLNEMRADISNLQRQHPEIAEEFIKLRNQLDASAASTQCEVDQRYNASRTLEKLVKGIRAMPDFSRFLLAPTEDEIRTAADFGAIAIINVSDYRCDALIIERNQTRALPLRRLHKSDILDRAKKPLADPKVLEWLWDTVAQPIIDILRFTQAPLDGCWPRMWWVLTGPLARMPIHAAGYHSLGSHDTVLDRVISSYSSSVKAIIHSRQTRSKAVMTEKPENVVLVGMEKTPGSWDLQFAAKEIDMLEKLCSLMKLQVTKPRLFQKDILSALTDCDIFHFAGHGRTDQSDPSKSSLLLKDWEKEPLTVATLFETSIHSRARFLAYLSACGTGQVKHTDLIDEGLHLISACQLAGFRHIVGTLWGVNDEFSVNMAKLTYEWMIKEKMTDESVSRGLHNATRELRNRWLKVSATTRHGRKLVRKEGISLAEDKASAWSARDIDDDDNRLPRDADVSSGEEEEAGSLLWVPYVHFGV